MKDAKKYLKASKKPPQKISSVSITLAQAEVVESEKLNVSALFRDFLDDFLLVHYPKEYSKAQRVIKEDNEELGL